MICRAKRRRHTGLLFIWIMLTFGVSQVIAADFRKIANHPEAQSRYVPGSPGRHINNMAIFNNRLYLAYGKDDGPTINCPPSESYSIYCDVHLRYVDLDTQKISASQIKLRTQLIRTLHVNKDMLYVLADDVDSAQHFVRCTNISCTAHNLSAGVPEHLYGMLSIGNTHYIAGSGGVNRTDTSKGIIWKSTNGITWEILHTVNRLSTEMCCARYAWIGSLKGVGYAQAYTMTRTGGISYHQNALKITNTSLTNAPQIKALQALESGATEIIYLQNGRLTRYDGVSSVTIYSTPVSVFAVTPQFIYAVHYYDNTLVTIAKSTLEFTTESLPITLGIASLVHDNGYLYVGSKNGEVFTTAPPIDKIQKKSNILPILMLLLLDDEEPGNSITE